MGRKKEDEVEEEEDEGDEVEGSFFYVNRDGFPIKEDTWDRMYDFAAKNHPLGDALQQHVRERARSAPDVPIPTPPGGFSASMSVATRLEQIQSYMSGLKYNHTGTQFFEIKKARPISGLMECAKDMIKEALPIKCLEALVLGVYLTNDIHGLVRFNISFKTLFEGGVYRHVVLGVYHNGKYGALGMSRRKDLMYKPLKFESLSYLVRNFFSCYSKYGHLVRKIKIGNKITKDPHSFEPVPWKGISLELGKMKDSDIFKELERHSRDLRVKNPYDCSPRMPVTLPKTTTTSTTMGKDSSLTQSLAIPSRSRGSSLSPLSKQSGSSISGLHPVRRASMGSRSRSFVSSTSDLSKSVDETQKNNSLHRSQTIFLNFDARGAPCDESSLTLPDINARKGDAKLSSSDTNISVSSSNEKAMSYKIRV